jgi:hypothetical protein
MGISLFNYLCMPPRSAESDKKKREHFIKRLNEDIQSILSLHEYSCLQDVINKAIGLESKLQEIMSKKRKREFPGEAKGLGKVKLVSIAKLVDTLSAGAGRNL